MSDAHLISPKAPTWSKPLEANEFSEIERFLLFEARLLDEERYAEWLSLMADDVRYWMPGIQARYRKDKRMAPIGDRMAYFDDDLLNLRRRVTRFLDPTAWAEDPPTRTVHIVTNIEAERCEGRAEEFVCRSIVTVCRGSNVDEESRLSGRRVDHIRRVGTELRLARREIWITQAVLLSKNLNVFL